MLGHLVLNLLLCCLLCMPAERLLVGMPVGMAGCLLALLLTSSLFLGLCTCQELSVLACFCVSLLALSWVCLLACCCPPGWPACACANSLPRASGLLLLCLGLMRGDKEHPQDTNLGIQLALRLRLASQILIQVEKSDAWQTPFWHHGVQNGEAVLLRTHYP